MTNNLTNIPVSVDYTSRDYYALRQELITRVKSRINLPDSGKVWTGEDPADFGVALIEAFAYMGDILNYYIDRAVNESFLPTATQRQNVINLANIYGYKVAGYRASTVVVTFFNSSTEDFTVPSGTQVSAQVLCNDVIQEVIFTTQSPVTVPAATYSDGVLIAQGSATTDTEQGENVALRPENLAVSIDDVAGELVAISDGLSSQIYVLLENQVVDNTVSVFVQNGDVYELWNEVQHLADAGPNDKVYAVDIDADNFVYVLFGDGVSGAIPPIHSAIKVQYSVGGGSIGNISADLIDTVLRIPNKTETEIDYINTFLTVRNLVSATGGADPESNDSIRINAPRVFSSMQRAVSLQDYERLSLAVKNSGKAHAIGANWNSITLYVGPKRDDLSQDQFPGFIGFAGGGQQTGNSIANGGTAPIGPNTGNGAMTSIATGDNLSAEWTALATDLAEFLYDKIQIGTSVTIVPPAYSLVDLGIVYTKYSQYTNEQVEANIKSTIVNKLGYNYIDFGQTLSPEDVEYIVRQADGVKTAAVTNLQRLADPKNPNTRSSIIANSDELLVFAEAQVALADAESTVVAAPSLSSLGGISVTPTFSSSTYNYTYTGTYADTLLVAATSASVTATIAVNGKAATVPVSTPSGAITIIPIIVTEIDGSVAVYTVTVDRS